MRLFGGNKSSLRGWPRILLLILAMIPVAALVYMIVNLATGSKLAISELGISGLFSPHFSYVHTGNLGQFGLLPALWGTTLVVLITMCVALPLSLAIAIMSTEFPLGPVGKALRLFLGVAAGIPALVYAFATTVFITAIIGPKFGGTDLAPSALPPPGQSYWYMGHLPVSGSTLLAGLLLALFVTPFIAPLIADAIENVPSSRREASLALGADRWHTLRRVTLPGALPGISSAALVGVLKAVGDVMIVAYAVGYESGLPNPLFDILQRTATLTSTAIGLTGGFVRDGATTDLATSVANFAGLLLLFFAFAIMGLSAYLQRRFKKRFAS